MAAKCLVIAVACAPFRATIAQPLQFEILSTNHGLPGFVITTTQRDDTGYLWIGTQDGVRRFDGLGMQDLVSVQLGQTGPQVISSIEVDPGVTGSVWIAVGAAGVLRYDAQEDRLSAVEADLSRYNISSLAFTSERLWMGTASSGLLSLVPSTSLIRRYQHGAGDESSIIGDSIRVVKSSRRWPDQVWVGTTAGLSRLDANSGKFAHFSALDLGVEGHQGAVVSIAEQDSRLWYGTENGQVVGFNPDSGAIQRLRLARSDVEVSALTPSRVRPGTLWVGTRGLGLFSLDIQTGVLAPVEGFLEGGEPYSLTDVLSIEEDMQGLLWVGSVAGLYKADLKRERFGSITEIPGGAPVLKLYQAPSQPGVTWAGTIRGGLFRFEDGRAERVLGRGPGELVFAMLEDSFGQLWLGTTSVSLYALDRGSRATVEFVLDPGYSGMVKQIYEAPSRPGMLWAVTKGRGLIEFDAKERRVTRRFNSVSSATPLPADHVWVVLESESDSGYLWVGTDSHGLFKMDVASGDLGRVGSNLDCFGESVISLAEADGALWAGTRTRGLIRFIPDTQECRSFSTADGLSGNDVGAIFLDDRDRVWMSTSNGITVFDEATETFTRFFEDDGLQADIFHYPASFQEPDGTILFGGPKGFNAFHPETVSIDTIPPPVVITRLLVNGQPSPLKWIRGALEPITLAHNRNDLEISYAALDLRRPERNRYRVRIGGEDSEWREVGDAASTRYTFLAPNRYRFEVQASNADGFWNPDAATLEVRIKPPIWQVWYFIAGLTLFIVGLVAFAYQYRIRQMRRVEKARAQIADDLHDDIGSKMSSVALRLDLAGRKWNLPPADREQLEELSQMSRDVVGDLRDTVWIVDAGKDHVSALIERIEEATHAMLRGREYHFESPEKVADYTLGMEDRRHAYLIFKEALHNAARHGNASRIQVVVRLDAGNFFVTVEDDGNGFEVADLVAKGRGLSTMRDRAKQLGSTLDIDSTLGTGTRVSLEIKLLD